MSLELSLQNKKVRGGGGGGWVRIQERVREWPHLVRVNALEPVMTPD